MSGPAEGTYALRKVIIGKGMGLGGMYATQREFGAPITASAQVPSVFEYQDWKVKRTAPGSNTYYIENAHLYPSGTELTGFHNHSLEDGGFVTLGQPRVFTIESVDGVESGEDVYIIRPSGDKPNGVDICIGVEGVTVVTKVIPVDAPLEGRPAWRFVHRHSD